MSFDDQQDDEEGRVDTIPSKSVPEYEQYKKENPYISGEGDANISELKSPVDYMKNFAEQKGIIGAEGVPTTPVQKPKSNSKVLKSGIKSSRSTIHQLNMI